MNDATHFAVFLFPQAIDALGEVIKPYLADVAPVGPHIVCSEIDPSGPFFRITVAGHAQDGKSIEAELMLPNAFVKLVVSLHSDQPFGFVKRSASEPKT